MVNELERGSRWTVGVESIAWTSTAAGRRERCTWDVEVIIKY